MLKIILTCIGSSERFDVYVYKINFIYIFFSVLKYLVSEHYIRRLIQIQAGRTTRVAKFSQQVIQAGRTIRVVKFSQQVFNAAAFSSLEPKILVKLK